MEIFPAIDLRGGRVVRLTEGDYGRMKVYGGMPVEAAMRFRESGARNLHIIDLDGAKDGQAANFDAIARVCAAQPGLFVEVGGGIRDDARVERYIGAGAGRVIIGTAAVKNFQFVEKMVSRHGDRIAVSVDARDGMVAVEGWTQATKIEAYELCARLRGAGVHTIIYTDIARDGTLRGANLDAYRELASMGMAANVVAAGGITEIREVAELRRIGVSGAVLGKALYEGRIDLARAIAVADGLTGESADGLANENADGLANENADGPAGENADGPAGD